ncbi:uncharacterized protein LOC126750276 isoform X2 [Anthonomus grandis grandis]|uniref:uncharacterized protein LOC126750276 isoform X2 n=1 Tax=Anthonomus grandis grandis TaxID=2921223 RepID=UPI002166B14E|nr:uncharacterized protein LOC126750276 isoform X2 [Anthonomus grandis grandis]
MVTICAKKYMNTREKLLLDDIRKRKESKDDREKIFQEREEFFKKLTERREKGRRSSVLSGTTVPNSTFKSIHSVGSAKSDKNSTSITNIETEDSKELHTLKPICEDLCRETGREEDSVLNLISQETSSGKRSSILSGTGTIEELKELRDLLHKSSYVPKQIRTRTPTIEKIKTAIKQEKRASQELSDLSESYTEPLEELSDRLKDASTLTDKKKKKKKSKSASKCNAIISGAELLKTSKEGRGKKSRKTEKVDIEIQCSIYKMGKKTRHKRSHEFGYMIQLRQVTSL